MRIFCFIVEIIELNKTSDHFVVPITSAMKVLRPPRGNPGLSGSEKPGDQHKMCGVLRFT